MPEKATVAWQGASLTQVQELEKQLHEALKLAKAGKAKSDASEDGPPVVQLLLA